MSVMLLSLLSSSAYECFILNNRIGRFCSRQHCELLLRFIPVGLEVQRDVSVFTSFVLIAEKPQPFDFLVDGELVRTSLEQLLLIKKISAVSDLAVSIYVLSLDRSVKWHGVTSLIVLETSCGV